jgi:hypothetical protein
MTRLDDYHSALRVGDAKVSAETLGRMLDKGGPEFTSFIVDYGLGPLWSERTGRAEFRASRLAAEALYAAQEHALFDIDTVLGRAGITYVVFKGAANRLLLYDNPVVRACHDLDLLVRREDRLQAARVLSDAGFEASPGPQSISRELVLSRAGVNIDLHWELLREGRLRADPVPGMLDRRRRVAGLWMLADDDAFFTLLVHPAFAKHLAGWEMGLHRVLDISLWLRVQPYDWDVVRESLEYNGVKTAAWATLYWVTFLMGPQLPGETGAMLSGLQPRQLRRAWVRRWLEYDLPARTSRLHLGRLVGFSLFLHDTPRDAVRALAGRWRAKRRQADDLAAFGELFG